MIRSQANKEEYLPASEFMSRVITSKLHAEAVKFSRGKFCNGFEPSGNNFTAGAIEPLSTTNEPQKILTPSFLVAYAKWRIGKDKL